MKGNQFGNFKSFGRRGEEAGGKVNQAGSKLLRGQAGGKDYPTPQDLPGVTLMRSEFSSVPSGWNVVLSVGGGSLKHGSCLHPWQPSHKEGGQDSVF